MSLRPRLPRALAVVAALGILVLLAGAGPAQAATRCIVGPAIPQPEVIVGYAFSPNCPAYPPSSSGFNAAVTAAPSENLSICAFFLSLTYVIPSGWVAVPEPVTSPACNLGNGTTGTNNALVLQQLSLIPGISVTDSARFQQVVTPAGLATAFGANLTTSTASSTCTPTLGNTRVWVLDGQSPPRFWQGCLLFASPGQMNFQVPSGVPAAINTTGRVFIYSTAQRRIVGTGAVPLRPTAPALFSQAGNGQGRASANILRVRPDGSQVYESINTPINVNTADTLYLVLYGLGIRNVQSLGQVSATVAGLFNTVVYAGPQGATYDQVNVLLDKAALANVHGEQPVRVSVSDPRTNVPSSNVVTIPFL